ncbi:corticotropin-releasing factor-binding protein-like [Mytilus californianus]|uniref:corticotropin-releasing factor-binding protein-like n=1 Tax=Mytilus californianus TaxID=6549 RepID=UPI00224737F8|nr:corticotropin-releasing factor-binding protein-like [Mytilus californianus]
MIRTFLILLCLIESSIINALPFKNTKKYDFLKRKTRSTNGDIGCMHMAAEPGDYKFTSDGSGSVCGLYFISPPEDVIELQFLDFDISCESGLLALVDGWEMNEEFFPSPEDHELTLEERYQTFCNLRKPSKTIVVSQNVALIQHLITEAGQGFRVRVRFVKSPQPCNVVSSTETGIHTLKNFGSRRNCSVSIIYPETVKLDSVDVGVTPKHALMEADFGITNKCMTSNGVDFVEVMGGNSFELNKSNDRKGIVCGMKSNTGPLETIVACQNTVIRLVSSGNFYNTVTFSYRPPHGDEFARSNTAC